MPNHMMTALREEMEIAGKKISALFIFIDVINKYDEGDGYEIQVQLIVETKNPYLLSLVKRILDFRMLSDVHRMRMKYKQVVDRSEDHTAYRLLYYSRYCPHNDLQFLQKIFAEFKEKLQSFDNIREILTNSD